MARWRAAARPGRVGIPRRSSFSGRPGAVEDEHDALGHGKKAKLVREMCESKVKRNEGRGGTGLPCFTGIGENGRWPWWSFDLEYGQPGGSRATIFGAKERGGSGGYVGRNGVCNGGVNRTDLRG